MIIKEEKKQMFGQLLLDKKIVNQSQIDEAFVVQKTNGKALGDILIDLGYTTSDLIMSVLNITQRTGQELVHLYDASIGMLQCVGQTSLYKFIITEAERVLEADKCNLFLVDEEAGKFKCFNIHNGEINEILLPLDKGTVGFVAKTAGPINLEDAYRSPLFDPQIDKDLGCKAKTVLSIPLMQGDNNKVIGVLRAIDKKGKGLFTFRDEWLFRSFAIFVTNAVSVIDSGKVIARDVKNSENMEMFSLAVENLSEGIIIIAQDGDSVVVNPAAKWMLGRRINRDLDKKDTIELLNGLGLENISGWLEGGAGLPASQEITTLHVPETRYIKVDFADTNAENNYERKNGCLIMFNDITREREFDRMKSEFITTASHELLSPITSMKNAVDIMLQGAAGANTAPQERFLRIINDGIEYISYLTTTLLDLSFLEIRKKPLKKEKVDLDKVIKSSIDGMRFKAEGSKISILNNNGTVLPVLADINRVRQTLLNLLDNAFKFTPHGGEVVVSAKTTEEEVEISIKDNGLGIFLEEQDKIFEKFYQIENSATKKHYGIGLGLSICKDIVEAHGGRIWVESKESAGSNFIFTLPLFK